MTRRSRTAALDGALLGGRLHPITRHLVFVEGRPAELASLFARLRGAALAATGGGATHDPVPPMALEPTLRALEPLVDPSGTRFLLVPTHGTSPDGRPWTLFVDNRVQGMEAGSPVAVFASRGHHCLQVSIQPHTYDRTTNAGYYGWFQLTWAWQRGETDLAGRTLRLQHNGSRWQWLEAGEVQPWERPSLYDAPRAVDRLPVALLHEYAASVGVRFADEDFYDPESGTVMVSHVGRPMPHVVEVSLDDARAAHAAGRPVREYVTTSGTGDLGGRPDRVGQPARPA